MSFYIQSVEIGGPRPFYLLGPCSLECESFVWEMARSIKAIAENLDVPLIFKASYDKANRTSIHGARGVGLEEPRKRKLPPNTWICSKFPLFCAARRIFWKPAPRAAGP